MIIVIILSITIMILVNVLVIVVALDFGYLIYLTSIQPYSLAGRTVINIDLVLFALVTFELNNLDIASLNLIASYALI